ncbi:hypothetical protein OHB41_46075 [Streptomyces sp. NBC_01571]|uniref:hypothetical protein n=1 Tax=Streptomyces sp. NBC_01571 TaxID=2975883 RepID=UPI00225C4248|nr:hypothetical protein [Streptomyces sp. NBC_01571]MCX4580402.1 hypothetical protein [Streptomyces sp. NBC_01571]
MSVAEHRVRRHVAAHVVGAGGQSLHDARPGAVPQRVCGDLGALPVRRHVGVDPGGIGGVRVLAVAAAGTTGIRAAGAVPEPGAQWT